LRALKALQISDANGVAMPHKWPENELIKDKVIVPPAGTVDLIKKRKEQEKKGEIKCYDWWLCYKELK